MDKVLLGKSQAKIIIDNLHYIDRFWKLSQIKGIGEKTYEKVFKYFYSHALYLEGKQEKKCKNINFLVGEQISLF